MVARVFLDFPVCVVIIQSRTCIVTESLRGFSSFTSSVCMFAFLCVLEALGPHCCGPGPLFTAVPLLPTAMAAPVAEHRLSAQRLLQSQHWDSVDAALRLSCSKARGSSWTRE